jgi:hypothetical protein
MKKIIQMREPRVIDGAVRYPAEGGISIDANEANRLIRRKVADEIGTTSEKKTPEPEPQA